MHTTLSDNKPPVHLNTLLYTHIPIITEDWAEAVRVRQVTRAHIKQAVLVCLSRGNLEMTVFEKVTLQYTAMLFSFQSSLSVDITGMHLMLNSIQTKVIRLPPEDKRFS